MEFAEQFVLVGDEDLWQPAGSVLVPSNPFRDGVHGLGDVHRDVVQVHEAGSGLRTEPEEELRLLPSVAVQLREDAFARLVGREHVDVGDLVGVEAADEPDQLVPAHVLDQALL